VLERGQAEEALQVYKQRGWLKCMAEDVERVEGNANYILQETNATHLFNVRFRQSSLTVYDTMRLASLNDGVWNRTRYNLAAADTKLVKQWRSQKIATEKAPLVPIVRKGIPELTYDPFHKRLQAHLLELLRKRYGKGNVEPELDKVDLTIRHGERTILIELKTDSNARIAIRHALGQLLEYAYYRPKLSNLELVILAPGKMDAAAKEYMERLRGEFKIPISYFTYAEGDPLPRAFE
jgi:hypothetical protein